MTQLVYKTEKTEIDNFQLYQFIIQDFYSFPAIIRFTLFQMGFEVDSNGNGVLNPIFIDYNVFSQFKTEFLNFTINYENLIQFLKDFEVFLIMILEKENKGLKEQIISRKIWNNIH